MKNFFKIIKNRIRIKKFESVYFKKFESIIFKKFESKKKFEFEFESKWLLGLKSGSESILYFDPQACQYPNPDFPCTVAHLQQFLSSLYYYQS